MNSSTVSKVFLFFVQDNFMLFMKKKLDLKFRSKRAISCLNVEYHRCTFLHIHVYCLVPKGREFQ